MISKSDADETLSGAIMRIGPKPDDSVSQEDKKRYSEKLSESVAQALAGALREIGLHGTRPDAPGGESGLSGAERRLAGGIGAKKVDVSWATEESGLLLAVTVKSINFRDSKTKNFQKNLTNRRGDLLFETVTLHRRFPYAAVVGFFFFDELARADGTKARQSTFENAHDAFRLFTGRRDPSGRDEQLELLYIVLHSQESGVPLTKIYLAGQPNTEVGLREIFDDILGILVERNADFYELAEESGTQSLRPTRVKSKGKRKGTGKKRGAAKVKSPGTPQTEGTGKKRRARKKKSPTQTEDASE